MQNTLKQFGGKDTASFDVRFNRSIFRLTALYAAALALILFVSGAIVYSAFSARVRHRFRVIAPQLPPPGGMIIRQTPTASEVRRDFVESVIVVHTGLFLIGALFSYVLARRTLQPIKDAYKRQQRFLSDASHELRTPLSILQLELENELAEHPGNEAIISKFEEVKRTASIVENLLLLSRLDELSEKNYALQPTDISAIGKQVADRLSTFARSSKVTLTYNGKEKIFGIANTELLSHALVNIVKNAILYNKEGGKVSISIAKPATVTISDTGQGIPASEVSQVFNRFYRVDASRSRASGGSGLGLSIAQSSVEKMNGSIRIESELGKGTTVTILLQRIG